MKGGVYRILTYSLCHIDFFHDSSFLGLMTFISCVLRNTYTVFPFSLTLLGRLFQVSHPLTISGVNSSFPVSPITAKESPLSRGEGVWSLSGTKTENSGLLIS